MEYDPNIVTYDQLLAAFWDGHNATHRSYSAQYRSAIFYTDEQQHELASKYKQAKETELGQQLYTDIEPFTDFYIAEEYHQKYYLRLQSDLADELYAIYPDPADFRDSTAAARLNGYVAGFGAQDTLEKRLNSLGLSESGKKELVAIAKIGLFPVCPVPSS